MINKALIITIIATSMNMKILGVRVSAVEDAKKTRSVHSPAGVEEKKISLFGISTGNGSGIFFIPSPQVSNLPSPQIPQKTIIFKKVNTGQEKE